MIITPTEEQNPKNMIEKKVGTTTRRKDRGTLVILQRGGDGDQEADRGILVILQRSHDVVLGAETGRNREIERGISREVGLDIESVADLDIVREAGPEIILHLDKNTTILVGVEVAVITIKENILGVDLSSVKFQDSE